MTVSTQNNVAIHRGNGATTEFDYTFRVLDETHLTVQRRDYVTKIVDKTYLPSEYTVAGIGMDGGSVTLNGPALSDDYEIVITRTVPVVQKVDIVNQGGFFPEVIEEQLDLTTMGLQQVREKAERSLTFPPGETGSALPSAAERAGKYIAFNASGGPYVTEGTGSNSSILPDLASTDPSKGAAMIGRPTVAALLSSATLGRGAGAKWYADKFVYEEAAPDAADHHLTTAGGVKLYVVDDVLCDLAFGPPADGISDDRPAILQWLNALKISGKPGYSPGLRRLSRGFVFDESWSGLTIYGDRGKSVWKFTDGATFPDDGVDTIENTITASMIALKASAGTTLSDFRVSGITIDGNRDNLSATPESDLSCGVYVAATGGTYRDVVFEDVPAINTGNMGYILVAGGVRVIRPICRGNRWHGIGVSDRESDGFGFGNPAIIENPITEDNGAYGIDFSRGRTIVVGHWQSRRNGQGGGKTSQDCLSVKIDAATLEDNFSYGFRTTGTAANLEVEIGTIAIRGTVTDDTTANPGTGFNMQSFKRLKVGTIICENNEMDSTHGANQGDIAISGDVEIGSVYVRGSGNHGLVLHSCPRYDIGFINAEENQARGVYINASNGIIRGYLGRSNNQAGTTGNDAPSVRYGGGSGNHTLLGAQWVDEDGGIFATQAVKLHVDGCDFSDLTPGTELLSAGAGTTVTFGRGNTGIVTYARGTLTADGDGATTTFNATLSPALTTLGGQTFNVSLSPKNADSVGGYVGAITSSNLQVGFGVAPAVGTGNVVFDYFVDLEVRR